MPPAGDKMRGELLSWLMFVASGVGPYAGQSVHFRMYAPEKNEYAINRYAFEAQRHFGILDARLAKQTWPCGAGRAACRSCSAKPHGRNFPT
jgi:GST-like protein